MSQWWNRLVDAFNGLEARERVLVSIVGALALAAILYAIVIAPILRASQRGEDRLATADQQLAVMQRLRRDYDDVKGRLADVEQRIQRGAKSELRTTLEALASRRR
jgi:type II secretory pathway component PulM